MRFVSAAVVVCFAAVSAFAQSSDMFVTKTAPASTTVGSDITFTVTVGNNGPDDAPNGRFHDVLPADVTFVSINQTTGPAFTCTTPSVGSTGNVDCTVTSSPLAVGTFAQFDIVVNVSAPAAGTTLI
ncbi:MAG TPA: hypothetical protein VG323_07225, partial [Thermoanaerobaculia bacterium]|nr:hypothetical protein [Thermoanaerobaculia bacterium]